MNNVPVSVNVPSFLNGNTYSVKNVTSDLDIRVVFRKYVWSITATAGVGGTITPSGVTNVVERTNQDYSVVANPGYMIDKVVTDNDYQPTISTSDPTKLNYTFENVYADRNINATFKKVMVWWYATEKPWYLDSSQMFYDGIWHEKVASTIGEVYYFRTNGKIQTYWDGKLVGDYGWSINYSTNPPSISWGNSSSIEIIDENQMMTLNYTKSVREFYSHH